MSYGIIILLKFHVRKSPKHIHECYQLVSGFLRTGLTNIAYVSEVYIIMS